MADIIPDHEEILDLVDIHEQVTGSITHLDAYDEANLRGNYLRASDVLLVNDKGQLWIPRRTEEKKIAPGGLDYSAGEHVMAGESYVHGALRGLSEELNIEAADTDLIYIGKLPPSSIPYFSALYVYRTNESPDYNRTDFTSAEWIQPADLIKRLRSGHEKAKIRLVDTVELYLKHQAESTSKQHRNHQIVESSDGDIL